MTPKLQLWIVKIKHLSTSYWLLVPSVKYSDAAKEAEEILEANRESILADADGNEKAWYGADDALEIKSLERSGSVDFVAQSLRVSVVKRSAA